MRRALPALLLAAVLVAVGLFAARGSDARPDGTVRVALDEFTLTLDRATVPAGPVAFVTSNVGDLEHEIQVIRTDLEADGLPLGLEGVFYEEAGELVLGEPHEHHGAGHEDGAGKHGAEETGGAAHPEGAGHGSGSDHIVPDGTRRDVVDLAPGRYVVLCNLPGHYAGGQSASLTVR